MEFLIAVLIGGVVLGLVSAERRRFIRYGRSRGWSDEKINRKWLKDASRGWFDK